MDTTLYIYDDNGLMLGTNTFIGTIPTIGDTILINDRLAIVSTRRWKKESDGRVYIHSIVVAHL